MVRSPLFQGVDAGSIPVETTNRESANVGELGWSVKSVAYAWVGSNPTSPTNKF